MYIITASGNVQCSAVAGAVRVWRAHTANNSNMTSTAYKMEYRQQCVCVCVQ